MEKPLLRNNIHIIPYTEGEQRGVILQDTFANDHGIFVGANDVLILTLMNGQNTIREIQHEISRQTGNLIHTDEIARFVGLLSDHFLLENEKYFDMLSRLLEAYKSKKQRPCLMDGSAFPDDPDELMAYMDKIFDETPVTQPATRPEDVRGIVVPHIDIPRGQASYVHLYSMLRDEPPADCYVILGVNHTYHTTNPFIVTDRDYATPLGPIPTDQDLLQAVQTRLDWDLLEGELAHQGEHSVEFPALFLRYLYPKADFTFLPVLCNYFDKNEAPVEAFIAALRAEIANAGKSVVIVASVDFSHLGPQFGWQRLVEKGDLARTEQEDRATLQLMADNQPDAFFSDIMKDDNERNIDALGAGYVFLRLMDGQKGHLIHYDQAYHAHNTVTFASLLF